MLLLVVVRIVNMKEAIAEVTKLGLFYDVGKRCMNCERLFENRLWKLHQSAPIAKI